MSRLVRLKGRMELMRGILIVWGYVQLFLLSLTFRIYPQASADFFGLSDAGFFFKLGGALFFAYLLLVIYNFLAWTFKSEK